MNEENYFATLPDLCFQRILYFLVPRDKVPLISSCKAVLQLWYNQTPINLSIHYKQRALARPDPLLKRGREIFKFFDGWSPKS